MLSQYMIDLDATYDAINEQNGGRGIGHTLDGVHGYFRVERDARGFTQLVHIPSKRGRKSDEYRRVRADLQDDYVSCYTGAEWPEAFWRIVHRRGLLRYKS